MSLSRRSLFAGAAAVAVAIGTKGVPVSDAHSYHEGARRRINRWLVDSGPEGAVAQYNSVAILGDCLACPVSDHPYGSSRLYSCDEALVPMTPGIIKLSERVKSMFVGFGVNDLPAQKA